MEYGNSQFQIVADSTARLDYGLIYPLTYQFIIPPSSNNIKVWKRKNSGEEWSQITEKTSEDFFNGIEAVRFDYPSGYAYVSVSFYDDSDSFILRFTDADGKELDGVSFLRISKYYDNRKAVAVFTMDDWGNEDFTHTAFKLACDAFTSRKIWTTAGIYHTLEISELQWSEIQEKIDAGYIEPCAHSRTHPHQPYDDYDSEVGGSKQDIIDHLSLPPLNKRGSSEYILCWITPYSYISDNTLLAKVGEYKYLTNIAGAPPHNYGEYPDWDSVNGLYEYWDRYIFSDWVGGIGHEEATLSRMNSQFDYDYQAGNIYHLGIHPWGHSWEDGEDIVQHLNYVMGKKDVWYVGMGHLFSYRYASEREKVTITQTHFFDNLSLNDSLKIKYCSSNLVRQSKYGTFKYGQRKYGKNVTICEERLEIVDDLLIKINGKFIKFIKEDIGFSDNLEREVKYHLNLSDFQPINENLEKKLKFYIFLIDSISFSDGKAKYTTINLLDSLPIETLIEINFQETPLEKSNWKFIIRDDSGKNVASLVNARKRWFVQRLNDESEAGFILDADDDNCNSTILNLGINELYIYYKEVLMWSGQLVSVKKIASGDDIYWEVFAKDWVSLLGKRFVGIDKPLEYTTTDAGEIAWDLIDTTQNEVYGDFGITKGTIQPSITRSPVYDRKNILEAIKELSNQGDESSADTWGFDFEITPEKVFNVYYPYMGTVRQGVVFRYPGNCENFEALVDSWTIVNHEWGFGKHWTGNDAVVERSDATSQAIYKRREKLKSYSDVSVLAFLQDMVWQDIQWLKEPSQIIKFDARVDEKVKITDYNVGDGVVVINDKFDIDELLWVFERKVEIDENDELSVRLTVGD